MKSCDVVENTCLNNFARLDTRQQIVLDDEGGVDGGVDAVEADWWSGWNPLTACVDEEGKRFVAGVEPEVAYF